MENKLKQSQTEKIRRQLTKALRTVGFERSKTTFWTRSGDVTADFIHLHLFSFSPAFRIHLGIRVLNDPFEAAALNGPNSDEDRSFRLEFNSSEESIITCCEEILRYINLVALPWFQKWQDPSELVESPGSPLKQRDRDALIMALNGHADTTNVKRSRSLLGLD
jgi:hypothetical protein